MRKQAKSIEVAQSLDNIRNDLFAGTTREKTAESLFTLSDRVAYGDIEPEVSEVEEPDPEDEAVEWLNKNSTPVVKKGKTYWWFEPKNLHLNRALLEWNLWTFTTIPLFHRTVIVRDQTTNEPRGLLLRLKWSSAKGSFRDMDTDLAKKIKSHASHFGTIKESVRREIMAASEQVDVSKILGRLLPQVDKIAKRRIGMKGEAPLEIWPLDGGKPTKF